MPTMSHNPEQRAIWHGTKTSLGVKLATSARYFKARKLGHYGVSSTPTSAKRGITYARPLPDYVRTSGIARYINSR